MIIHARVIVIRDAANDSMLKVITTEDVRSNGRVPLRSASDGGGEMLLMRVVCQRRRGLVPSVAGR